MKAIIMALCLSSISSAAAAQAISVKETKNIVQQEIEFKLDATVCDLKLSEGWGGMDSGDRCELKLKLPMGGKLIRAQVVSEDRQVSAEFSGDKLRVVFSGPDRHDRRQAFVSNLTLAIAGGKLTVNAIYVGPQLD
jgi:hypothetical protein